MSIKSLVNSFDDELIVTLVGPLFSGMSEFTDPVIFVDGGSQFRHNRQGWSVGDGDSAGHELDEMLDTDKDVSDLGYALQQLKPLSRDLHLLGFLGGRRDHEWFNMGEVHHYLMDVAGDLQVRFDDRILALAAGRWQLTLQGGYSLACLQSSKLTMSGDCKYHITPNTDVAPLSSFGLSNVANGVVLLESNNPVFILASDLDTDLGDAISMKN